jgi:F-type H+-transporting ATPase subunit delta
LAETASGAGTLVSGIAGRYASALFELAGEAGQTDAVGGDLKRFLALVDGSADLDRLVRSPAYTAGQQVSAVSAILDKAKIGGLAANFIKLTAAKRRLFAIRDMAAAYQTLADAKAGIAKVDPAIIGGIIVKMGSKMVDSSVRTKLNSLKIAMKEAV